MHCELSRHLSRKITKHIHSSKPASLNRPIAQPWAHPNVVPRPTKCCTLYKKNGGGGGGGRQGREVVVYWSLATLRWRHQWKGLRPSMGEVCSSPSLSLGSMSWGSSQHDRVSSQKLQCEYARLSGTASSRVGTWLSTARPLLILYSMPSCAVLQRCSKEGRSSSCGICLTLAVSGADSEQIQLISILLSLFKGRRIHKTITSAPNKSLKKVSLTSMQHTCDVEPQPTDKKTTTASQGNPQFRSCGRPGLSVLTSLLVSVDVKNYWTVLRHWSQLVPNMSTDIWGH